jgi:hypothetical protein
MNAHPQENLCRQYCKANFIAMKNWLNDINQDNPTEPSAGCSSLLKRAMIFVASLYAIFACVEHRPTGKSTVAKSM